ncbi:MAG: hypothetical protein AABY22_04745 [Nanoarchaeota archaeon]
MSEKVTYGADPEFVLESLPYNSNLNFFSHDKKRKNRFGKDRGGIPLRELRPAPSKDPITITNSIRSILQRTYRAHPELDQTTFRAGSYWKKPLGGHIHICGGAWKNSVKILSNHSDYEEIYTSYCQKHINPFINLLDWGLAIPLFLVEFPPESHSRKKQGYGGLGSWRVNNFQLGIEYRTPPSWLVSPHMTLAVFSMVKLLTESFEKNPSCATYAKNCQDRDVKKKFKECNISYFNSLYPDIKIFITSLPSYSEYSDAINYLWDLIESNHYWNEEPDGWKTWGIKS